MAADLGKKHKGRILPIAADVRDPGAIERAVAQTVGAWGGLDVVVSNAGAAPEGTPGHGRGAGGAARVAGHQLPLSRHRRAGWPPP